MTFYLVGRLLLRPPSMAIPCRPGLLTLVYCTPGHAAIPSNKTGVMHVQTTGRTISVHWSKHRHSWLTRPFDKKKKKNETKSVVIVGRRMVYEPRDAFRGMIQGFSVYTYVIQTNFVLNHFKNCPDTQKHGCNVTRLQTCCIMLGMMHYMQPFFPLYFFTILSFSMFYFVFCNAYVLKRALPLKCTAQPSVLHLRGPQQTGGFLQCHQMVCRNLHRWTALDMWSARRRSSRVSLPVCIALAPF
jgi:hypothetical protein